MRAGPGLDILVAGRAGPGPHNSICGPGPGRVFTTAAGPGRAWASNHICGPGLGLDFRPVQDTNAHHYRRVYSHHTKFLNTGFILHLSFSKSCGVHDSVTRYTLIYSLYGIFYFHWHTRLNGQTAFFMVSSERHWKRGYWSSEAAKCRQGSIRTQDHPTGRESCAPPCRALRGILSSLVQRDRPYTIKNGVLQGSVLAPMPFNICTGYDIPKTSSTKYI